MKQILLANKYFLINGIKKYQACYEVNYLDPAKKRISEIIILSKAHAKERFSKIARVICLVTMYFRDYFVKIK